MMTATTIDDLDKGPLLHTESPPPMEDAMMLDIPPSLDFEPLLHSEPTPSVGMEAILTATKPPSLDLEPVLHI